MRKATKIWLVAAVSLIVIGGILFGGVMTVLKWDFTKLSTRKYETNRYEITEDYQNISIVTDTADIVFEACEEGKTSVVCYEQTTVKHAVSVQDGSLVIEVVDTRKWYEHIGIGFDSPKITVCLPEGEYGSLQIKSDTGNVTIPKELRLASIDISEHTGNVTNYASVTEQISIQTSTGNICVEGISTGSLTLSVSTGRITVSDVSCTGDLSANVSTGKILMTDVICKNLGSKGSTGNLSLTNVVASECFSIERSTGDVKLDGCDAAELFIKTDTGDVKGSLLSEKVFIARTDTGRVDVPKTVSGGRCEITTDTGNIIITVD